MKKVKKPAKKAGKVNKAPKGKAPKKGGRGRTSQPALPGMSKVRNRKLDLLCESIGHAREEKNRLTQEEAGDAQAALREMLQKGVSAYVHFGVRLTCKKGVDKLGIQLVKDKSEEGARLDGGDQPKADAETGGGAAGAGEPGQALTDGDDNLE